MAHSRHPPGLPVRRSVRHPEHDYTTNAWYHVTLVTASRRRLFGNLAPGRIDFTPLGQLANDTWGTLATRVPHISLGEWTVMPDHFHGMVWIQPQTSSAVPAHESSRRFGGTQRGALSSFVNLYKGEVTRLGRRLLGDPSMRIWHRGYHERLIRTRRQWELTRAYIRNNPMRGCAPIDKAPRKGMPWHARASRARPEAGSCARCERGGGHAKACPCVEIQA